MLMANTPTDTKLFRTLQNGVVELCMYTLERRVNLKYGVCGAD